jgi:hypothetical protein
MGRLTATIALLLLAAAPAHAQWEPPDEVLQVRIKAEGDWSVRCEWQDRKGKTLSREASGEAEKLHLNRPQSGTCTYRADPGKPLTIRLKSSLYRCTLPATEPKTCQQTFAPGASGQIEIRKRD